MLKVLQCQNEINLARMAMKSKGRSALDEGSLIKILRRMRILRNLPVGDMVKSWDVAQTLEFIEAHLPLEAEILDLGAFCSEVPVSLAKMGFTGVSGIDLNPHISKMPFANLVNYTVSDFMEMPYSSESFNAVTAISVIEHGYDPERLFAEISRILRPDGYFIASFDYWPKKINTGGASFFGMSWLIFSKEDVSAMVECAKSYNLTPLGSLETDASERPIKCMGYEYTFAWMVFKKT